MKQGWLLELVVLRVGDETPTPLLAFPLPARDRAHAPRRGSAVHAPLYAPIYVPSIWMGLSAVASLGGGGRAEGRERGVGRRIALSPLPPPPPSPPGRQDELGGRRGQEKEKICARRRAAAPPKKNEHGS